jgi:hypothetical protein
MQVWIAGGLVNNKLEGMKKEEIVGYLRNYPNISQ